MKPPPFDYYDPSSLEEGLGLISSLDDVKLLAEKIETHDEFEFLKGLDFDFYQGYFFSTPSIVKGKSITANQVAILELVSKIHSPNVEVEELSKIISTDVSLSHKVLKFINSPLIGMRTEVDSIQQAVVLLGLTTIKNWITILALATGSNKPAELSRTALVRARSCELMAKKCKLPKPEKGNLGMLPAGAMPRTRLSAGRWTPGRLGGTRVAELPQARLH